ncbi:MAG: rod shape-determining protein MreC [Chroococcus sp. CMT-3BRIN-NPC107]|jgi:rod shape-determining protein MreC|nr:rod shape-determining protein MreC [Chroococcus sp. CMT-3BRIN-NPC107]
MYAMRRWWDKNRWQLIGTCLALGCAWLIRQTQGSVISELTSIISRPFQDPTQVERLNNARIVELLGRLVEQERQNQQLKDLLDYRAAQKNRPMIVAPVIGRSADLWWQQITLGRGSNEGIEVNFVVTAPGGLVGRVIGVTPNTSRVLLVSDITSQVGVTVSRSRYTGLLKGQSSTRAVMQFFDKVPDVRPGDFVATSPYSQIFPAGIPVGRVEKIDLTKSPAPEAAIALTSPLNYLEWVFVYTNAERQKNK